jgi:hypothetical protein
VLPYWPGMFVVVLVTGSLVYLYRAEIRAFLFRLRKQVDDNEALKDVATDWKQSGHIDFSTPLQLRASAGQLAESQFLYLTIEEYRLLNTIGTGAAVERRWRRASLADAREVVRNYYQFLQEHPEKTFNEDPRKLLEIRRLLDHPPA